MSLAIRHCPPGVRSRRVFIAVPAFGDVSAIFTASLFEAHPVLHEAGFDVEMVLLTGDCHVDDARNVLVSHFLASKCDDLLFIDADEGFRGADLVRLLNCDRDVVGVAIPKKSDLPDFAVVLPEGDLRAEPDGLLKVLGLGTGMLRIRRNVLERMAAESKSYVGSDGMTVAVVFERSLDNGGRVSGDINFSYKWRAMGGEVFADPEITVEHRGPKTWEGNLAGWLRAKHGLALMLGLRRIREGVETDADYHELNREWGNPWSVGVELLKAAVMVARQAKGPIIETGSGLSTLVMAAANPNVTVHALEHSLVWRAKVEEARLRLGFTNLIVHHAPLVSFPAGRWYEVPRLPWEDADVVLCDGPPRQEGNRRILWGVMATKDCRPRCVLVDDAETEGDAVPPEYRTEIKGQLRKFAVGLRN